LVSGYGGIDYGGASRMTPSERTLKWREDNPLDQSEAAQRRVIDGWVAKPDSCPYFLHRISYEIRSKLTGRKQDQFIHKAVRLKRAVITWYLLHGTYAPVDSLEFAPRRQYIALKESDLE
jgi:hypothetical protein